MKKTLLGLAAAVATLVLLAEFTDNGHVWQGLRECYLRGYKNAQVDDLQFKTFRTLPGAETPKAWPLHPRFSRELPPSVEDSTQAYGTVALAVVHRDSLLLDWISDEVPGADTLRTNAFSMAKTFTALAIGVAVTDGLIAVDDPVSKYLPRFAEGPGADLTVEHVLQMRSGIPFGENYKNPIGFMAKSTYGEDILDRTAQYAVEGTAGIPWKYQGGNTLVLQEILSTVVDMPLSDWFAQRVWAPIGAVEPAAWAVDNQGDERNYCCFYARATDYARVGQLLLDSGRVGDRQLIDRSFMVDLMRPVGPLPDGTDITHYGYQVWMGTHKGHRFVSCIGLHGQYIAVVPDLDLIAVRTGFFRPKGKVNHIDIDAYATLDVAMALTEPG